MRRRVAAATAGLALLLLGLAGWNWIATPSPERDGLVDTAAVWLHPPGAPGGPAYSFEVRPGEDVTSLSLRLAEGGLVRQPQLLRLLLRYYGVDREVRAGHYLVPSDITLRRLVEVLREGQIELVRVTIVEGWRAEEVADALQGPGIADRDAFLRLVYSAGSRAVPLTAGVRAASLEGFLFPDTYLVPPAYGAEQFLDLMLANFSNRVRPEFEGAGVPSGRPVYDALVLASVVEREAHMEAELPLIAATFLNRLRDETPLAADPTVQFALMRPGNTAPAEGYWKKELSVDELKIESPYNTYLVRGLPPGPISNPGLGALRAVLRPDPAPYRYFVAKPDGSHAFATTFQEHLRNVFLYQR